MSDDEKTVEKKLEERDQLIRLNTVQALVENLLPQLATVTNASLAEVAFATGEALVRMVVCMAKPGYEEAAVKDIVNAMVESVPHAIAARDLYRAQKAMQERANTKDVGHG